MLSEISQKKTNSVCYHLCVESRKIKLMNITKKKQTHKYRKQTVITSAENEEEGQDRGRQLKGTKYKIIHLVFY